MVTATGVGSFILTPESDRRASGAAVGTGGSGLVRLHRLHPVERWIHRPGKAREKVVELRWRLATDPGPVRLEGAGGLLTNN